MLDIDTIALNAAEAIEREFLLCHKSGAAQRKAKVQCHVLDAIRAATEPTCMYGDNGKVAIDDTCLKCGVRDGQDCKDI
jgi:hypothetical protein